MREEKNGMTEINLMTIRRTTRVEGVVRLLKRKNSSVRGPTEFLELIIEGEWVFHSNANASSSIRGPPVFRAPKHQLFLRGRSSWTSESNRVRI